MKLFISHSNTDNEIVKRIVGVLKEYGVDPWVDLEQIEQGDSIIRKIDNGLKSATHFLLIWSKNAINSDWVNKEIDAVRSEDYKDKIKRISFRLDETQLPPLDFSSETFHRIDSDNVEHKTNELITKISDNLDTQIKVFKKRVRDDYESFSNDQSKKYEPIIKNFKKFDGYRHYVAQSFIGIHKTDIKGRDISKFILDNLKSKKRVVRDTKTKKIKSKQQKEPFFIPIVADYGSGKSALSHYVLYQLCNEQISNKLPIFIPLGELESIEGSKDILFDVVFNYILNEYHFKLTKEEFKQKINNNEIIFIFDALDEMSDKLDSLIAMSNLDNLLKFTEECDVILTSRHTYLSGTMERKIILHNDLIRLLDFDNFQFEKFLNQKFGNDEMKKHDVKNAIIKNKIEDFSTKPLFLNIICENFNKLEDYPVINQAVILKILTENWIIHDVLKRNVDPEKKKKIIHERQRISEILAMTQSLKNQPIGINDIKNEVKEELATESYDVTQRLEEYYRDARDATFLTKEGDEKYRFILKPIMEYFIASRIVNDLRFNKGISLLRNSRSIKSQETFQFIKNIIEVDWAIKPHLLKELKHQKKFSNLESDLATKELYQYLETKQSKIHFLLEVITQTKSSKPKEWVANLVKIFLMVRDLSISYDLSGLNLQGINLTDQSLRKINFSDSDMRRADLSGSDLSESNLTNTYLNSATLLRSNFYSANLQNADLSESDLGAANMMRARLSNANMHATKLINTVLFGTIDLPISKISAQKSGAIF